MNFAINGLGRIGSAFLRTLYASDKAALFNLVAIKDYAPNLPCEVLVKNLAYLLQHDSIYGKFPAKIDCDRNFIVIDGVPIPVFNEAESSKINWDDYNVDVLVEASGDAKNIDASRAVVSQNTRLKKVIITRNSDVVDKTIVFGVNEHEYRHDRHSIISLSTCTGNAIAELTKFVDERYQIQNGVLSTIHPVLSSEKLLDNKNSSDFNIGRAAKNIKVTSTGVVKSLQTLFPNLKGRLVENAISFRIPTDIVSVVQATLVTKQKMTLSEVTEDFENNFPTTPKAGLSLSFGHMGFPLVATDFVGCPSSAVLDMWSLGVNENVLSAFVWHDNEMGYAYRILDCLMMMEKSFEH